MIITIILDSSIINYFEKDLSWDLFVQGFFLVNIFVIVFLLLMYMMPEYHINDQSFLDFLIIAVQSKLVKFFSTPAKSQSVDNSGESKDGTDFISRLVKIAQFLSLGTVAIVLAFITGVICSEVSDIFMDQSNRVHLGLKKNWAEKDGFTSSLTKTDDFYKYRIFYKVFGTDALDTSIIKTEMPQLFKGKASLNGSQFDSIQKLIIQQIYYEGKHRILEKDNWKEYLSYSQNLVNLNQTFCLGAYILLLASLLSLIVCFARTDKWVRYRAQQYINFELFAIGLFFCIFFLNIFLDASGIYHLPQFLNAGAILLLVFGVFSRKIRGYRTTTAILFVILSLVLYHLTAIAWHNCEEESDSKTYGLIRHFDDDLNMRYHNLLKKSLLKK